MNITDLNIDYQLILRLVVAAGLGYLIGLERRFSGHTAGERTFALTSLGAALFTVVSVRAFSTVDTRVAAGVVTGLGFLGAGMILKGQEKEVRGLTTAASIWTVGAIGLTIGAGAYGLGLTAAVLTFLLLVSERVLKIDRRLEERQKHLKAAEHHHSDEEEVGEETIGRG
jgi:putative Mg2+ transporter-C (MgtC) family protein